MSRKICFLTGTRADFGKLKPLMERVDADDAFDCAVFATGMHLLSRYGFTVDEIHKTGFRQIYSYMNHVHGEPMELVLANTVTGLSRYVHENKPDLLVVHGDRVEALAGAIVGALRNVLVAHVEGGELSGTVDELIRHSVTKLCHIHFVSNDVAARRLRQLGERPESIHVIGSPEIDVMLSDSLPKLDEVRNHYGIPFSSYAVAVLHPVTTEPVQQRKAAQAFVSALKSSRERFVVIYPNNDSGSEEIFSALQTIEDDPRFCVFPSMRFEYFLRILKEATFIVGNSSAGIREAPVFAVPTVNVGSRQHNRFHHESIIDVGYDERSIVSAMARARDMRKHLRPALAFGDGRGAERFMAALRSRHFWATPLQKQFLDMTREKDGAATPGSARLQRQAARGA